MGDNGRFDVAVVTIDDEDTSLSGGRSGGELEYTGDPLERRGCHLTSRYCSWFIANRLAELVSVARMYFELRAMPLKISRGGRMRPAALAHSIEIPHSNSTQV